MRRRPLPGPPPRSRESAGAASITGGSALQLPAAIQERVAEQAERDVDGEDQSGAEADRRIREAEEAVAEARDDVEEGVGPAHRLEGWREVVDRIEGAGEERQRRHDEIGHRRGMVELVGPDRG